MHGLDQDNSGQQFLSSKSTRRTTVLNNFQVKSRPLPGAKPEIT